MAGGQPSATSQPSLINEAEALITPLPLGGRHCSACSGPSGRPAGRDLPYPHAGGDDAGVPAEAVWRQADPDLPLHSVPVALHFHQDFGESTAREAGRWVSQNLPLSRLSACTPPRAALYVSVNSVPGAVLRLRVKSCFMQRSQHVELLILHCGEG